MPFLMPLSCWHSPSHHRETRADERAADRRLFIIAAISAAAPPPAAYIDARDISDYFMPRLPRHYTRRPSLGRPSRSGEPWTAHKMLEARCA